MKIKKIFVLVSLPLLLLFSVALIAQEALETANTPKEYSLIALFNQGGIFMWPILLTTAFACGIIIERFIYFVRANLGSKEFIDKLEHSIANESLESVEELCAKKHNRTAKIIQKGLAHMHLGYERVEKSLSVAASVEVALLERGLSIISAIANIAPMLGFLGTVSGMISAFADIAAADQVSAKIVAAGIQEALLTTAFGLIAAIPLLLFYNYFVNRIEGFITSIERLSTDIVEKLIKGSVVEMGE